MKVLFLSLLFITSCASIDSIKKNPNCVVWRDQSVFGPYSTEVLDNKVIWTGSCRSANWKCRSVEVSFDENKNIFLKGDINIGKIENNEFNYTEKDLADKSLTIYTALRAYPEVSEVRTSVTEKATVEVAYRYNEQCSVPQAIIGGLALGLIDQIQKEKH